MGGELATWIAEQLEDAPAPPGALRFRLQNDSFINYDPGQATMALAQHAGTLPTAYAVHAPLLSRTLPYYRAHLNDTLRGTPSIAFSNWQTQGVRALLEATPLGDPFHAKCIPYVQ